MSSVRQRVLVVDDEPKFVELVRERLELVGFEVTVAVDGETALRKVQQEPPDLIILDIILPNLDGYEVCTRIKRDPRTRHIPLIMLTVKGEEQDYRRGLACGAEAYFTKPSQSQEFTVLLDRLIKALSIYQSPAQEVHGNKGKS